MPLKLSIERTIPNMIVHCVNDNEVWTSAGYSIYFSQDNGTTFNKILDLPVPFLTRRLSQIRISSRALRLGIRTLLRGSSGTILVAANRKLFRLANQQLTVSYKFNKGFAPLRQGWCEDEQGNYYMAEYFLNNDRLSTCELLKSSDDGKSWKVITTLNNIRHIHCVEYDPFTKSIWIGTGDRDRESGIHFSKDGGNTWTVLLSGDQVYRAVSLLFTPDYIYWGGDAPTKQNHIVRYSRKSKTMEKLVAVAGTVFYSTVLENQVILFGTTDEGDSEGKNPTSDRKAHIWGSPDGTHWEDLISFPKDTWPYILASGKILFANGKSGNNLYFSTEALKGMDGVLSCASIAFNN
jgi:hypothetical protein